ncbi:hypothetical protein CGRA01v4_10704 [Colletotrichum graminicola]|nr:hypothetical protein CGRA01v4_10704 [Colletotrichum graminicola]
MMIRTAYNGADKTNPKLHLNEVLQAVWTEKAGLSLQSLSRVKFLEVANSDVKAACRYYRKKTKLEDADEFEFDVDRVSSKVYKKFSESPFGLVVGRLCSAAGKIPNAIAVDVRNGYDDVAWELI